MTALDVSVFSGVGEDMSVMRSSVHVGMIVFIGVMGGIVVELSGTVFVGGENAERQDASSGIGRKQITTTQNRFGDEFWSSCF